MLPVAHDRLAREVSCGSGASCTVVRCSSGSWTGEAVSGVLCTLCRRMRTRGAAAWRSGDRSSGGCSDNESRLLASASALALALALAAFGRRVRVGDGGSDRNCPACAEPSAMLAAALVRSELGF